MVPGGSFIVKMAVVRGAVDSAGLRPSLKGRTGRDANAQWPRPGPTIQTAVRFGRILIQAQALRLE